MTHNHFKHLTSSWRVEECWETNRIRIVNQAAYLFPLFKFFPALNWPTLRIFGENPCHLNIVHIYQQNIPFSMSVKRKTRSHGCFEHPDSVRLGLFCWAQVTLSVTLCIKWWWRSQSQHGCLQTYKEPQLITDCLTNTASAHLILMGVESNITHHNTWRKNNYWQSFSVLSYPVSRLGTNPLRSVLVLILTLFNTWLLLSMELYLSYKPPSPSSLFLSVHVHPVFSLSRKKGGNEQGESRNATVQVW